MIEAMQQSLKLSEKLQFGNIISALTDAVKKSNVKAVYNYPGRPATLLVDNIKKNLPEIDVQDYLPNEFVASAKGFGSSVGSERALVVFKDVGTNLASDNLHCLNHVGINRGLVFFVADDPSAWYSQNEQDSRGIYFNAELPFLEPYDGYSAYYSMLIAYELSEIVKLPFFIRSTGRALNHAFNSSINTMENVQIPFASDFVDIPFDARDKWKSIFGTVEKQREELLKKHMKLVEYYENINLNTIIEKSNLGIIASGFVATQLEIEGLVNDISLLKLATVYPLPEKTIFNFLKTKKKVLVIDQGEPLVELLVRDCAQRNNITIPILGKLNGCVRRVGEFRDDDLKISIGVLKGIPVSVFPKHKKLAKAPPYHQKDGYRILLSCLREAVYATGYRPLYAADAGQCCQIPETPGFEEMLHMEITMGASVPFLSGAIESYKRRNQEVPFKGIAFVGDSSFFHNAFGGICEAVTKDHPILMLLIDNQGAVSTGVQPHIGMKTSQTRGLSIKQILQSLDIKNLYEADVMNKDDLRNKLITGLKNKSFSCIIVRLPKT